MLNLEVKGRKSFNFVRGFFRNKVFQRALIGIVTIIAAYLIIENGATPTKYDLKLGDKSQFDISAPRDIENKLKTEQNARASADAVPSVMKRLDNVPIDVLNRIDDFTTSIEKARKGIQENLENEGITKKDKNYKEKLEVEANTAAVRLSQEIWGYGLPLSREQVSFLVAKLDDAELSGFKRTVREIVGSLMRGEVTQENLAEQIAKTQTILQKSDLGQEMKNIGEQLVKTVIKPNSTVDIEATGAKRSEAYKLAREKKVIIQKDERILSVGDTVTEDKLEVLNELNLLETGKIDYSFAGGILIILLLLASLVILYMNYFAREILYSRGDLILLSVIILLTLLVSRVVFVYDPMLIPVFIAPMLISILLDLKLAIMVNFILTVAISFIVKNNMAFLFMSMISGTFSAFVVSKANQRSRLTFAGLFIAGVNVLVAVCMGLIAKSEFRTIASQILIVTINGIVSIILTIGLLPFLESTFNIITPLKLLELANPNQPLLKKLLIEAPGTYHHSLMVGNLAEMATEVIEGNALLARVAAYYHDVGKLIRPNFFMENQMSDNPHDRMTPNLSTLVITSHTKDGVEIAQKYKIPLAIRDIIMQHHGSTTVVYFFHKAKKTDKGDNVKQEDFRYDGPKPATKEAAVVMLADCVEAAVRSAVDKTEGKIEGLVRKIIKDKLDDGQLDQCDLTLKDLDSIAKAFMRVFSGFFHAREEYPEMKVRSTQGDEPKIPEPVDTTKGE